MYARVHVDKRTEKKACTCSCVEARMSSVCCERDETDSFDFVDGVYLLVVDGDESRLTAQWMAAQRQAAGLHSAVGRLQSIIGRSLIPAIFAGGQWGRSAGAGWKDPEHCLSPAPSARNS